METIEMKPGLPAWAMQRVTPEGPGVAEVRRLFDQGRTQIQLPDLNELRGWAKAQGWPRPWFGFKHAFLAKLFESNESFVQALSGSGVRIDIPIKEHTLTADTLSELDALYEAREDAGALGQRPTDWGTLVSKLRAIRRLVEAGVRVRVDDTQTVLDTWQGFYEWAHARYHMLEDGYDSWIGDDNS